MEEKEVEVDNEKKRRLLSVVGNSQYLNIQGRRRQGRAYLRLGVRAEPGHLAAPPQLGHLSVETVGQDDGERHALLCLVRGVAEHQTLPAPAHNTLGVSHTVIH